LGSILEWEQKWVHTYS